MENMSLYALPREKNKNKKYLFNQDIMMIICGG